MREAAVSIGRVVKYRFLCCWPAMSLSSCFHWLLLVCRCRPMFALSLDQLARMAVSLSLAAVSMVIWRSLSLGDITDNDFCMWMFVIIDAMLYRILTGV